MIKTLLGLLLLIAISNQIALKAKTKQTDPSELYKPFEVPENWKPQLKAPTSKMTFIVDDIVSRIYLNYNFQPFQFTEVHANWLLLPKIMNLNLKRGDIITIMGINIKGFNGMLASINFFDEDGNEKIYNTGADWTCDGVPAVVSGPNNGKLTDGKVIEQIPREAKLIWAKNIPLYQEVACSFVIPAA